MMKPLEEKVLLWLEARLDFCQINVEVMMMMRHTLQIHHFSSDRGVFVASAITLLWHQILLVIEPP